MSINNHINWVIGPAGRCVELICEETKIASVIQQALVSLSIQEPLLQIAREKLRSVNAPQGLIAKLQDQTPQLNKWAQEIAASDFDVINRHGLIGMWVAIEVAVEDTAVLVLCRDTKNALDQVAAAGVKVTSSVTAPLSEEEASKFYQNRLERHALQNRPVAEGYCYLLSLLGIRVVLSPECAKVLSELNALRNCLLHRSGVADERVLVEAPSLALKLGDPIRIGSQQYMRYFDAVGKFASALLAGTVNSTHVVYA